MPLERAVHEVQAFSGFMISGPASFREGGHVVKAEVLSRLWHVSELMGCGAVFSKYPPSAELTFRWLM